jgi:hypothetical protein
MKRLVYALLLSLLVVISANSQTFRGAINGIITDPSGAAVAGASVKAIENATGIEHSTVTTSEGQYSFQDIPLGSYKIVVTMTGFPVTTFDKIVVTAGTIYTQNIQLALGQQATTIEVSAASITLDTTTQTQSMTLTSAVVQDVPLNGRDFTQLIATAPGYGGYSVGGYGSLNGTRPNQMNWQIDGVDNNDFWHNIPAVNQGGVSGIAGTVMPIDAIDEFSAQTQSSSEAGRNAGGTVNLVIKSGTNTLHGSAYYYNRNEFYGAASPFLPSGQAKPKLRNENYGGTIGGRIIPNRTFYFVGFEKQDYIIGLSGLATEPSDAWVNNALGVLEDFGVPESPLSATLMGPNGLWPRDLIGGLPATTNNFFSPIASTGYSYNGVIKLDHNITNNHHIYARWFGGQGSQTAPLGGSPALGTASSNLHDYFEVAPLHVYNYSVVLNSTFSPRLTNQVLTGVNYFNQVFHDFNNSFDSKALGLYLSPDATINGQPILGAPNINISGFEQIGLTPPEGRNDVTWHLTDIVSYSMGTHQLRFGGEFRQGRVNEFYHRRGTGSFNFDGSQGPWADSCAADDATCAATIALADFLAGDVSSSSIAVGNPERFVTVNGYNFFAQDAWQITKRLSLTFGLRYEYFGPLHSDKKDLAVFVPDQGLKIQGVDIDNVFPPDRNNFAPRFGFAYQANSKGDLVVRGGIGVFYDQINMNPFLDFRPPSGAADGLQDNPIGPAAVSNYSLDQYNWDAVQAGGNSVFGPAAICTTLNAATDPNCGTNIFNVYSVNQNFRAPYFYNYSLQVEKGLGNAGVLQVGYVGSQGRKLNVMLNINQNGDFDAQYPNVGTILQLNSIGTSNYNALQTTFRSRAWHGLTTQVAYTWSHAMDEVSEYRGTIPSDSLNIKADYGNGDYDTRHLFTIGATYEIPRAGWAHGWSSYLVNGWQLSTLMNFHTGQPFDEVRPGVFLTGDPFQGVSHDFVTFPDGSKGRQWVNPAVFTTDPAGVGNVARNTFHGPGFSDVDFSVFKNIPLGERLKLQLRAEMYNLFNRVNLASGPGSVDYTTGRAASDTIGDWNGAPGIGPGEAFNMQLVAKIIF